MSIPSLEVRHNIYYVVLAVGSSGILKAKQKLGVTFNFDKEDFIDFTKFSKMTMTKSMNLLITQTIQFLISYYEDFEVQTIQFLIQLV